MPAYSMEEYLKLPQPNETWLWDGIIPAGGAALLYAKQKIGKSFISSKLAEAVADPDISHYLGQAIGVHGPVLYVQLDTPRGLWINNYLKNIKSPAAQKNLYMMDREMDDIPMPFDIRTKGAQQWIREQVREVQPVLTIADTFRRLHRCNENDNTEMAIIYDILVNITQPGAMLLLTHEKKQQQEGQEASARGASSVVGAVDCLIHMTKNKLKFEARSDINEEMRIFQQDDGTFTLHDGAEEVDTLIEEFKAQGMKPSQIVKALASEFQVSERTARRWNYKA